MMFKKQLQKIFSCYFIILCLSFLAIGTAYGAKVDKKQFTVVIDAGHGGKDIGATDNGVMEKNINLKVAKELETLIEKRMKKTKVVMTREGDNYLTLQERADKANKAQADLFISIHTNSVDKKNKNRKIIEGSSVYTVGLHKNQNNLEVAMRENSVIELEKNYEQKYSGFDPQRDESYIIFEMAQKRNMSQSIRFAESVERELVRSGRQNRGVHQAGFWVLWATSMPSVLIELDFICNPRSAEYLSSDKGAKELAEAIYKAVEQYEGTWSKNLTGAVPVMQSSDEDKDNSEQTVTMLASSPDVAQGRIRTHKTNSTPSNNRASSNDRRKRRSAHSKDLSLNRSYETQNLTVPGDVNYASLGVSESKGKDLTNPKEKDSNKKTEKKKKEKPQKTTKAPKEKKSRRDQAHNAKVNKIIEVYKIQILASEELLNQQNPRFCGLKPISTFKENNLYKYYYGESTDKAEIEQMLIEVRKKIPDAFIISSRKSVQMN